MCGAWRTPTSHTPSHGTSWAGPPPTTLSPRHAGCAAWKNFLLCTILLNLPSTRGRSYSHHVSTGINICFSREERSEADNFLFQILTLLYFSVVFSHIYNHVLAINIVHWGVVTHVTTKHFVWISKLIKCKSKSVEIEFILMWRKLLVWIYYVKIFEI